MPSLHEVLTPGQRDMRKDPAFPDVPVPDAVEVFNGHLADLKSWIDLAVRHADRNSQTPERVAYQEFHTLVLAVETAFANAACCHQFVRGDNCNRLVTHHIGFEGYCERHIEAAQERRS